MKIVQSFGSCSQNELLTFKAGWYSPEYHLMGWTLSCLQLTKHYNEVILHADSVTARMLIDNLNLPYTDVKCSLDELNTYHPQLWALPKIHTYANQNTPFLHVDGDVIIWKPFDDELLNSGLIAQNIEVATSYYENMMKSLKERLIYIPSEIIKEGKKSNPVCSYNAGIFGGNDVAFFNLYANKAIEFINKNVNCFSSVDVDAFNILFEQYLFHSLVQQNNKKVNVLFDEIIGDNEYVGFGDFSEVPYNKQYLHLIGTYKRNKRVCEQLANRLRQDYPEYYYRIIALFKNKQVSLKKDYYYFMDRLDEERLTARYSILKAAYKNNELPVIEKNNLIKPGETSVRTNLVKDIIANMQLTGSTIENELNYSMQLSDLNFFGDQLTIISNRFKAYSKNYLYARDLIHTQYFQFIFEEKGGTYNKTIVADPITEIIESQFDWSETNPEKLSQQLNSPPSNIYTGVVPECDLKGYSLINIDDLDMLLLQTLRNPVTISEVLNEIKIVFDEDDLQESPAEFELLITGRIKMALENKLIKAII